MATADTVTGKDAAGSTVTLGSVQLESGVEAGAVALSKIRYRVQTDNAFGVTTTPYSIGDVVDVKLTLSTVAIRNAASLAVVQAYLILPQTMPAVIPAFNLWLFNDDPGTVGDDNAALAITETVAKTFAGVINFNKYYVAASGVQIFVGTTDSISGAIECQCTASADDLYGVLEIRTATTFASGEMHLIMTYEQDR